ncbi:hypothetical protein IAQ61_004509 [Plenodomus lingam]|nr:hypothetical protein IAQ61_004509 [Plenodomus lingam]
MTAEMEQKRTAGWARDRKLGGKSRLGNGTPGHRGHEKMQEFFQDTMKRTNIGTFDVEEEGADSEAERRTRKRAHNMPRRTDFQEQTSEEESDNY